MKLKSLILGSIAAAGLSTAGFAADLGVLTSLDVCDELGLSGLTISSDTNCLQISGEVKYEFHWGNYSDNGTDIVNTGSDTVGIDDASDFAGTTNNDYESRVQSWLKFVGTAGSDFGPASAVIKIKTDDRTRVRNGGTGIGGVDAGPVGVVQREKGENVVIDEAYVQVGDATVLTAGKRGSIFNEGDDEPFNFTGLFGAEAADSGILADEGDDDFDRITPKRGGHVIQLWTNIGEGLIAKVGLENLNGDSAANGSYLKAQKTGTLVGVLDYAGSGVTAHISGAYGGILDGAENDGDTYQVHAGATATFDNFKVRAAGVFGGYYDTTSVEGWGNYWNVLASGEATFDMFKVALSAEAINYSNDADVDADTDFGIGGSIGATVAEGIEINLGGRYFNDGTDGVGDGYQVALQVIAAVTETIKLTGEIGVYGHGEDTVAFDRGPGPAATRDSNSDFYASAELGWNPGGGFSSSLGAKVQENGAYKVTFKAAKSFQ